MSQICARNTEHRRRYYPERAQSANIHGEVTLDCALNADNSLSTCQIVDETPPDYGFGDSALALACLWRLSEDTTGIYTSEASGERRIRKPVRFRLN